MTFSDLSSLGAVTYETNAKGLFIDPSPALAEFFLGHGGTLEEMRIKKAPEFYVLPGQRVDFLTRLHRVQGRSVSEYVLLRLGGKKSWCRCSSMWLRHEEEDRYAGLLVRLEPDDEWVPGERLGRMGWGSLRVDVDGTITFASRFDARRLGCEDATDLVGKSWAQTHWRDPEDCQRFMKTARDKASREGGPHQDIVPFMMGGRTFQVEIQAHLRDGDDTWLRGLEVFWRDTTPGMFEQQARLDALDLRNGVQSLELFEKGVVACVARRTKLHAAGLYRRDKRSGAYMLRAETGLPAGHYLPREITHEPDVDSVLRPDRRLIDVDRWPVDGASFDSAKEFFFSVGSAPDEDSQVGYIWAPLIDDSQGNDAHEWLRDFCRYLGVVFRGSEYEAAERAKSRALNTVVDILLSGDTTLYYSQLLSLLREELSAEGGSIFSVRRRHGEPQLVLVASSGIKSKSPSMWCDVTYRLGEGLTGTMALQEQEPVSLRDVEKERERRNLGGPFFVENVPNPPRTWLGCPITDVNGDLIAYIRLVNRQIDDGPIAQFSDGDVTLIQTLASVVGQGIHLEAKQREHQEVIARSFHELLAPVVAIRSHVSWLRAHLSDPKAETKCTNIHTDADLLLSLLDTIRLASRDEPLRRERTLLFGDVIVPLRFGLGELARRRGYRGLDVRTGEIGGFRPCSSTV